MTPLAEGALLRAARDAPAADVDELAAGGVLVVVPHPDDETLGCGAALVAAVEAGHEAHVVVLTDGGASHPRSARWPRERLAARRAGELADALDALGEGRIGHDLLGYPDQGCPAPSSPEGREAVARLASVLRARAPAHLWTVWEGDPHVDHERCAALCEALLEAVPAGEPAPAVTRFAVWGRFVDRDPRLEGERLTRFVPTRAARERKARAIAAHATQMSPLIDDDPDGFVMSGPMQTHFLDTDELFLRREPVR